MDRKDQKWFSRKEVIAALDIDARLFRHYVEIGLFPLPYRRGKRSQYWTDEDLASMIHAEKNKRRFIRRRKGNQEKQ